MELEPRKISIRVFHPDFIGFYINRVIFRRAWFINNLARPFNESLKEDLGEENFPLLLQILDLPNVREIYIHHSSIRVKMNAGYKVQMSIDELMESVTDLFNKHFDEKIPVATMGEAEALIADRQERENRNDVMSPDLKSLYRLEFLR